MKRIIYCLIWTSGIMICSITNSGCKKFVTVTPPPTSVNEGNVYKYDGTAISAVLGIYTAMSANNFAGTLSFYPELSADNLTLLNVSSVDQFPYYSNSLSASDGFAVPKPWLMIYPLVFQVNAAIKGLNESQTISQVVKEHLLGQVYFLRAFFYFYLTNFYGEVPIALNTDYTINNNLKRSPIPLVYAQIISDLKLAQSFLSQSYLTGDMINSFANGEEQRVTPNKAAASALLARVYLYQNDWANAEIEATKVIDNSFLYTESIPLDEVFLKNSKQTIWAIQPVIGGTNANEADMFTLLEGQPNPNSVISTFLTEDFMNSFQVGDQRKSAWINVRVNDNIAYPYPAKYKALSFSGVRTEQSILLRLSEQYLIRAEARIQQGKISEGIADLNILRNAATDKNELDPNNQLKPLSTSLTKEEAIGALNYEMRVELFAECGQRWLYLKRTGQLDSVMNSVTAKKGGTWSSYKALYPIPDEELKANLNLVQNNGYN